MSRVARRDVLDELEQPRIGILERFGLPPWAPALRDSWSAVRGNPYVPRNEWGLSSVRIFKPRIGFPTWFGHTRPDGLVPIYNFVNRTPRPRRAAYSVKVTTGRDYRGGRWTYDGHLGTDFACPVGSPIVAAAPGVVMRVAVDMDMGGRKVCIDHGDGLFTTSNHLSRALVAEGDCLARGQVLGLSGVSGTEFVCFFPWVAPHLHFNVWLDGGVADPFAPTDEESLWLRRNDPVPHPAQVDADGGMAAESWTPTAWDADAVEEAVRLCRDPAARARIMSFPTLERRAAELLLLRSYKPTMFDAFPPLYGARHARRPSLDLPFRAEEFVGVAFPEDGHGR